MSPNAGARKVRAPKKTQTGFKGHYSRNTLGRDRAILFDDEVVNIVNNKTSVTHVSDSIPSSTIAAIRVVQLSSAKATKNQSARGWNVGVRCDEY